jgi:hypothetical protein
LAHKAAHQTSGGRIDLAGRKGKSTGESRARQAMGADNLGEPANARCICGVCGSKKVSENERRAECEDGDKRDQPKGGTVMRQAWSGVDDDASVCAPGTIVVNRLDVE